MLKLCQAKQPFGHPAGWINMTSYMAPTATHMDEKWWPGLSLNHDHELCSHQLNHPGLKLHNTNNSKCISHPYHWQQQNLYLLERKSKNRQLKGEIQATHQNTLRQSAKSPLIISRRCFRSIFYGMHKPPLIKLFHINTLHRDDLLKKVKNKQKDKWKQQANYRGLFKARSKSDRSTKQKGDDLRANLIQVAKM